MSRVVTSGICDAALGKIGARTRPFYFYSMLRRVNARRQIEIADIMEACSDFSFSFLNLLIFATEAADFVRTKRRMRGLSKAELAMIERIVPRLEAAFRKAEKSYADDATTLMVTQAYVRRILANASAVACGRAAYPRVFRDLERLGFHCAASDPASTGAQAGVGK